jgi:hypothetical protein
MTPNRLRVSIWIVLAAFGAALSGCASAERPNVYAYPTQGQTPEQSARDANDCAFWAKQQTGFDPAMDSAKGAGVGALVGAVGGAAAGAAIGAATGNAGRGAAIGAAAGGIGGAATGGVYNYSRSKDGYDRAYASCMGAKGYSVR